MAAITHYGLLEAGKTDMWRLLGLDVLAMEDYLMPHPDYDEDANLHDNIVSLVGQPCMDEINRHFARIRERNETWSMEIQEGM
jgi:hypothetical protein